MKYLMSLIIGCTIIIGASANYTVHSNNHAVATSVDIANELPSCLVEIVASQLETSNFTTQFMFTNSEGKYIYSYETSQQKSGYLSASNLTCEAGLIFGDTLDGI